MRKTSKQTGVSGIFAAAAILAAISIYNLFLAYGYNSTIDEKIKSAEDLARPANIEITKITADCKECSDISGIIATIKKQFKVTETEKELDSKSSEAKKLIEKYNITKLPTIIVTGESEKAGLSKKWNGIGTIEKDGALVMRNAFAPYIELPSGTVRGKPDIILLNDTSCGACYDVAMHKNILKGNFAMYFSSESVVDTGSSEGKALVSKYNITKVPTVLVSPEAKYYGQFDAVWAQVGSVEADGWFVFRNMEAIQGAVYRDLILNKVV